jgi:signal transduction histidine kinase
MLPYLVLLGAMLLAAAWVQVRIGLAPLDAVRLGLKSIRSGTARRLPADYPDEVDPLAAEVNALLDAQDDAIERARAWTADLAHGLKTPLVALAADAERLRNLGQETLADDLDQLAQTMRRRVDRELIRGRIRARAANRPGVAANLGGARQAAASLGETLESVLRTLARTPRGAAIDWDLECPADVRVALAPEDLTELLGNLLENAAQWARTRVRIRLPVLDGSGSRADSVELSVEDDGPGVPAEALGALGQRGLRLDERTQGSGLGLAIAQDICDAYASTLSFGTAALGGLAVNLRMPRPPDRHAAPGTHPAPVDRVTRRRTLQPGNGG